eukprot:gb/GECH01003180.1/.p1 GENE.gb/GECH01003180.1/~~gb/GECH01003180.1/.p1  ORF type:complete len:260 (+),score=66.00 gb/GECH01003180.1/:1-780(+)
MEQSLEINLFITGFGKFNGVEENPSTLLVNKIKDNSEFKTLLEKKNLKIVDIDILEVSVKAVDNYFDRIKQQYNDILFNNKHHKTIFLHFGIAGKTCQVFIEKRAKNDMSFRVPDEQGFQPAQKPIDINQEISHYIQTDIDVDDLVQQVNSLLPQREPFDFKPSISSSGNQSDNCSQSKLYGSKINDTNTPKRITTWIDSSTDAGLFLCNYIFFKSLEFCESSPAKSSLFVHIPPLDQIDLSMIYKISERIILSFNKIN